MEFQILYLTATSYMAPYFLLFVTRSRRSLQQSHFRQFFQLSTSTDKHLSKNPVGLFYWMSTSDVRSYYRLMNQDNNA
jgi:hypothetical protein